MQFRGLNVSIETDEGELRHWYDPHNDEKGTTKMKFPYGYIRRTKGVDGDHIDVYVGPYKTAKDVFIIHQMKAPDFKKYDEDKCMIGFRSAAEAKAAYLSHYNSDKFYGSMTIMPFEEFKEKVLHSFDLKRPHKIAETLKQGGTSLKFIRQLEKDFGEEFARNFFKETTQSAKGEIAGRPMTARIEGGVLKKSPMPPPLPPEALQPPPSPFRTVTAAAKCAATPMQMINRKFLLYPELPDVLLGRETPKTRLEELAEAVLPEEEPKETDRRHKPPPHSPTAIEAPETAPDEQPAEEPKKKEAAMNQHLKLAYSIGGESAIVQFIKDAKLAISGQVKTILQNVRSLMAQGRSSEAIDAAYKAVSEGQIPHEALQTITQRGAPMEKQIWEGVRGIKEKALVDPTMKGNLELIQRGVRPGQSSSIEYLTQPQTGGAAKEVSDVLSARPAKTTWQHTPEEMKAFAEKGEAGLAPATEAATAPTTSAWTPGAAVGETAEAATQPVKPMGVALPLLAGGALGAGGYGLYQSQKQPQMPAYYKGAALSDVNPFRMYTMRDRGLVGDMSDWLKEQRDKATNKAEDAIDLLRSKLSADAQITGSKGTLLKSKTMALKPLTPPKMPSTSSLPKTPALTNVLKKLSQTEPDLSNWGPESEALYTSPEIIALRKKLLAESPEQAYEMAPHEGAPFETEHPGVDEEVLRRFLAAQAATAAPQPEQASVAQGTSVKAATTATPLPTESPAPTPTPVKPPAPAPVPTTPPDPVKAAVDKAVKEAQNLGDPNFWAGGTPAEGEMAPAATAEDAVKQLPLGTFQGMTTKVTPEGERSTSVNVTPDALASPDIIQSIFAAEPGAKVEVKTPEQPEMGGEELVPPEMAGAGGAAPPLPA
jgi:hypothetical protein